MDLSVDCHHCGAEAGEECKDICPINGHKDKSSQDFGDDMEKGYLDEINKGKSWMFCKDREGLK